MQFKNILRKIWVSGLLVNVSGSKKYEFGTKRNILLYLFILLLLLKRSETTSYIELFIQVELDCNHQHFTPVHKGLICSQIFFSSGKNFNKKKIISSETFLTQGLLTENVNRQTETSLKTISNLIFPIFASKKTTQKMLKKYITDIR